VKAAIQGVLRLIAEVGHLAGTFDRQRAMRRIQRLAWSLGGSYGVAACRGMMRCVTVFGRGIVLPISVFGTVSSMELIRMAAPRWEKSKPGQRTGGVEVMSWRVSLCW
jgi:hypothetical protein